MPAVLFFLFILILTGCGSGARQAPAIGVAYAGPAVMSLRKDIPLESPVVATVKHGDKLDIIRRRRRFMLVRTAGGTEGWIEDHLLLSAADIAALQEVEQRARKMPSQGVASTYEVLNVHTQPNRLSPSFFQVKQGEKIDVVAHVSAPRSAPERKPLVPPRPKTVAPPRKRAEPRVPLPPMPAPPPVPADWLELSKTPPEIHQQIEASRPAPPPPAPREDWSLVRNAAGQSGWVLSRRLYMAIPDDVAQYAEGHRITSYFPMSAVQDGEQVKHNWLWTTIAGGEHPYDFDNYRVFIWSLRRHRYETAYIQRNVEGYFPVFAKPSGFSVCLAAADGNRIRHEYTFAGNLVRPSGQRPCEAAPDLLAGQATASASNASAPGPQAADDRSFAARFKALAHKWFHR